VKCGLSPHKAGFGVSDPAPANGRRRLLFARRLTSKTVTGCIGSGHSDPHPQNITESFENDGEKQMKGGLGNIMKQAQKMQENLQKAQAEIAAMEIGGESGGGLVKVTITGRYEVRRISIDDSLIGDDKDMLEDLVAAAFNDAVHKVERTMQDRMGGLTAGMGLPPGLLGDLKLPF